MLWSEKDIIYEDNDILVTYKPAGLPVESRRIDVMTLERQIKNRMAQRNTAEEKDTSRNALNRTAVGRKDNIRNSSKQNIYLAAINRIDQVVEGIVLFAKNAKAAANLSRQLQDKEIEKIYLAVTAEKLPADSGTLENYLVKEKEGNSSRIGEKKEPGAKLARLSYELLGQDEQGRSLLKIRLETGRHHQIRVQMAAAGMPLVGDRKYGDIPQRFIHRDDRKGDITKDSSVRQENQESGRLKETSLFRDKRDCGIPQNTVRIEEGQITGRYPALCARELSFRHPSTKKKMHFSVIPKGKVYSNFIGLLR